MSFKKWHKKRRHGQFFREMPEEIDKNLYWKWLVQSDLKVQTEQALRTNYTNNKIDKTLKNPLCGMCGEGGEAVQLAQRECKRRHDTVAKLIHWKLCEKHNFERKEKWYEHFLEGVVEDDDVKLIWDVNIQCDNVMEARRPNLICAGQKDKIMCHHDCCVPGDCKIREKEIEKIE